MMFANKLPLLAIDNDIAVFERERSGWEKSGFEARRAENMAEAVRKLMVDDYMFVAINGDSVDFMPMLRTMQT